MNCERARELFSDYLEGSMDPALAAVIRDHVDRCPDCAREFGSFKVTWSMLSVLPDIEPPRDLRHEVVMRAVRLQQERAEVSKRSTFSINWDRILSSLIPMRPVAVAVAAAALAFVVLRFPQQVYHEFTGMFSPRANITQPVKQPATVGSPVTKDAQHAAEYASRKLGRNTVWINITPKQNGDGKDVYCVTLSINKAAFLPGEVSQRMPAQVYLLPAGQTDLSQLDTGSAVWTGSILENSPVVVPCLMDDSNSKAGTVSLLVVWEFMHRRFGSVVFVPTHRPGETSGFSAGGRDIARTEGSLYAALQGMAEDYGVPIVANAYLTERPGVINLGRQGLKDALTETLKTTGLDWVYTGGAVYVDRK